MLASETLNLSLADAENLLGSDESQADIAFVNTHLEKSASEIRSLLKANLTSGVLNTVISTSAWTREEADRQRQETRRVFNDVGTNLFNRMKFSQINGIQLDTDYNISISWTARPSPRGSRCWWGANHHCLDFAHRHAKSIHARDTCVNV